MKRVNLMILGALILMVVLMSCGGRSVVTPTADNPAVVDQVLVQELTLELERQLKEISRISAPTALVWYVARTRTLYWVLAGDYNLDGIVSISDITPVAIYFGTGWRFPTSEVVPWWVDGNGDRQVSIADITPIAVHFGNVAPRWVTSPVLGVRQVEHRAMWAIDLPEGVNWWDIIIYPGEPEPPPNQPPVASFTACPTEGNAPLTIDVDGSASYDPDGIVVEYRWYFHGGGGTFIGGNIPRASYTYDSPGTYSVWLVVVDDDGETDWSDQVQITVTQPMPEPILTSLDLTPATVTLSSGQAQQFVADAYDQNSVPVAATFVWTLIGSGTLTQWGHYTTPATIPAATSATIRVVAAFSGRSLERTANVCLQVDEPSSPIWGDYDYDWTKVLLDVTPESVTLDSSQSQTQRIFYDLFYNGSLVWQGSGGRYFSIVYSTNAPAGSLTADGLFDSTKSGNGNFTVTVAATLQTVPAENNIFEVVVPVIVN